MFNKLFNNLNPSSFLKTRLFNLNNNGEQPLLCNFGNNEGDNEQLEDFEMDYYYYRNKNERKEGFEDIIMNENEDNIINELEQKTINKLNGKNKYQTCSFVQRRLKTGLNWITAALFIIADMAGGGVVAIPIALLNSGIFIGSFSILFIGTAFCYTAHILGKNWMTMCRRWPEIYGREHCRKPYPEMAFRAMGEKARFLTSCTLNVMLFGVSVVYILLAAKITSELLASLIPSYNFGPCIMALLLAGILLPIFVVSAMLTTCLAVFLILLGTLLDLPKCSQFSNQPNFNLNNYFLSIGIFFFAFGGHGVFPTIQHDMKRPRNFTRSSLFAFIIVALMYIPLSYFGYFVYGDSLQESIISSIQIPIIQQLANLLIALHCILTITIVINPLNQEVEHFINIPHHFCWQRVIIRTSVMIILVFVALTVPSFGPILNLMGGTCVALISAVMPCLFYLYLHALEDNPKLEKDIKRLPNNILQTVTFYDVIKRTPKYTLIINITVIVIAIICGIAATNSAFIELSTSRFSRPCYFSYSSENNKNKIIQSLNCCGTFRNISRWPINTFQCPLYKPLNI
ncbi:Aa_trans domain-containing protein [Meloidogyne graminicola]|uniref:Aa_trans domain-containing protein n=1 Tax=Meloidogyne graminicola TaxID=189291 RepID=A0A8S9ZPR1_9BILA|nr:Aa_trans domain-containing protein [Meloidogyne graminicola]